MSGKYFANQSTLSSDNKGLILEGEGMTFLDQCGNIRIFQKELVEPCDLGQHLQIGEVLRLKVFLSPLRRITGTAKSLPQLMVARIASDHVHRVRLKQVLQGEEPLVDREVLRGYRCSAQEGIVRGSGYVVLQLRDQRGDEVEGLVDVGKLIQQLDHAVIIFEGVQSNPRQTVLAGNQIFVVRLMLVPENDDAQCRH